MDRADEQVMRLRLATFAILALGLAATDLLVNSFLSSASWDLHQRSSSWTVLSLLFLVCLIPVAALPSWICTGAAAVVAAGVLGSVVSAMVNHGGVPDPLVLGGTAFNLGDVFLLGGLPILMVVVAETAIHHREVIDRHIPPRRWEHALRRKLGV
jgi:hypothetical protein